MGDNFEQLVPNSFSDDDEGGNLAADRRRNLTAAEMKDGWRLQGRAGDTYLRLYRVWPKEGWHGPVGVSVGAGAAMCEHMRLRSACDVCKARANRLERKKQKKKERFAKTH